MNHTKLHTQYNVFLFYIIYETEEINKLQLKYKTCYNRNKQLTIEWNKIKIKYNQNNIQKSINLVKKLNTIKKKIKNIIKNNKMNKLKDGVEILRYVLYNQIICCSCQTKMKMVESPNLLNVVGLESLCKLSKSLTKNKG